ncbi:MAG: 2-amino-4-hydroxy-6-hydroxymethyldihydropteridine diphosphokinase [Caldilineaceae bacterium]
MNQVLIALGSNMEKEQNAPAALALLRTQPALVVRAVSPLYETTPIGADGQPSAQPPFHNGAVLVETALTPDELRDVLRQIEAQLGRVRNADKFAARPIDLDIAMVRQITDGAAEIVQADRDILRFIHLSAPLADLAPDWIMPQNGETLRAIAERHRRKNHSIPRKVSEEL